MFKIQVNNKRIKFKQYSTRLDCSITHLYKCNCVSCLICSINVYYDQLMKNKSQILT